MSTVIAKTISRAVLVICILFSIYLLLNGGNYPGGGFVGGVLFACGIALVYVTYGMTYMNARLKPNWMAWVAYGLLFASLTAIAPMFVNHRYFRSAFEFFHLEFFGIHIGHVELVSSMFFDIGVYFTVVGVLLFIITSIASDKTADSEDALSESEFTDYTVKPKMPEKSAQTAAAESHELLKTEELK
jgi:Multisubunit Na+/H+ antiporter, MnhB subunit